MSELGYLPIFELQSIPIELLHATETDAEKWAPGEVYPVYQDPDTYMFGTWSWLRGKGVFHAQVVIPKLNFCWCTCEAFAYTKGMTKKDYEHYNPSGVCKHLRKAVPIVAEIEYQKLLDDFWGDGVLEKRLVA